MKEIVFTDIFGLPEEIKPMPASKAIPDWYKNTESYVGGVKEPSGDARTTATIKKCMPVLDAITAGYILPLPADIVVSKKEVDGTTMQWFEWANFNLVGFHPVEQAPLHPEKKPHPYIKFNNPWSIKTPPGYSCLFIQPLHREAPFTVLAGVVDTDTYINTVNFPLVINDPDFEGLIPQGTPMAQVIPFKREEWKMSFGDQQDYEKAISNKQLLMSKFFDSYKTKFWHKKDYR
jgi:hypothetical protein